MLSHFNHVRLFVTPWTIAHQIPLSTGFSRQEYWSGLPCPPPEDLPNQRIEPVSPASPALQADSLLLSHQGNLNSGVHVSLPVTVSSGYMPSSRIAAPCGSFIPSCSFLKESPYCSPQWLHQFTFPPTVQHFF